MVDAVIIGGGLAGLACALALVEDGLGVTVLEREPLLGGRARSWQDAASGDTVDIGPHVVHTEYRNMLTLLQRLGTRELITWETGKLLTIAGLSAPAVLRRAPLPPPLDLLPSLLAAPDLGLRDIVSMVRPAWRGLKLGEEDVPELDHVSALEFLRSAGVTPRMIEWLWALASMVVAAVPLERCSAGALLRVHAGITSHRGLYFGFPSVGLAELFAGQSTRAIEARGGEVRVGARVRAIIGAERAEGVQLEDGTRIAARWVISTVPPQDLHTVLPERWRTSAGLQDLGCFEPSPYVSTYLWFDRKVTRERFWAGCWSPSRYNYDFYDLSNIRRGWERRDSVIATNIIYSHRAHDLTDREVVDVTVREIAEFAPEAAQARVVRAIVNRIPMAIPAPTPGTEARRPAIRSGVPGLLLAGDWVRTHLPCTMESAVRSGWLAAEAVLEDVGRPRSLALPQRPPDGVAAIVRALRVLFSPRGRQRAGASRGLRV